MEFFSIFIIFFMLMTGCVTYILSRILQELEDSDDDIGID